MVLEHLFPEQWLEKKGVYALILGAGYSLIGIILAKILFPKDPALVAVAITAILMLPELYKMFSLEEKKEEQEKRFSVKELFKDNKDFVKTYLLLAAGIFIVYAIAASVLPSFQVNTLFQQQLEMRGATGKMIQEPSGLSSGMASIFSLNGGLFWMILKNNWWVLFACFFVSLLTGDGAIFLITWNASLWGTIFGVTARNAALYANVPIMYYLLLVLLIVLPHAFLEILSYILGAISGGVISKDVILEKFESARFNRVFMYNFMLFIFAILILIIGVVVETWVLGHATVYKDIILQSYMIG